MTLDPSVAEALAGVLDASIVEATPVRGGDVAAAYRLELGDGRVVFAKTHRDPPPGFFLTEAAGLEWLRSARAVAVPAVLAVDDDPSYLALEWIEQGRPAAGGDERFGRALADLHGSGAASFGREDRRPTGSRSLPNDPAPTWSEFYSERRLRPLAELAGSSRALGPAEVRGLLRVADRLPELMGPDEAAARLHGDLWGGNRLVDRSGASWLIDPAAFGGHREFDLAMMRLFGGFGASVFAAYAEACPLADGWEERVALHQLAPLVVHAIKFGGGYVDAAAAAIRRYV